MSQKTAKLKKLREKKEMAADFQVFCDALADLRQMVDNLNQVPKLALRGSTFQGMNPKQIFSVKKFGWKVGYQLEERKLTVLRRVYVEPEQPFIEIPDKEKNPVVFATLSTFIDAGVGIVDMDIIAPRLLLIQQEFTPLFRVEKNPKIVVPGGHA